MYSDFFRFTLTLLNIRVIFCVSNKKQSSAESFTEHSLNNVIKKLGEEKDIKYLMSEANMLARLFWME
jgi:hypothetical protein